MQKRTIKFLACAALLGLGLVATAHAAVPAPPVNQLLGIPDTVFNAVTEADCRVCHGPNPPANVPVNPTYLPDRHHNRVGDTIGAINSAPFGNPGETYQCTSCHQLQLVNGVFQFQTFRDCNFCHTGGSPHHTTQQAVTGDCVSCHGSFVDNGLLPANRETRPGVTGTVPKWLPTYAPSQITPWASRKTNAGPNGEGSCYYCHASSHAPNNPWPGQTPAVDPASGILVYSPADTHHSTTLASDPAKCAWCHTTGAGGVPSVSVPTAQQIRVCQNCHGIPSLHNIQYAAPGTTVQPGQMQPWFGHIGNNQDCFGCHGFTKTQSVAPMAGPVTPQIDGMTKNVVIAGEETIVELVGINFVNSYSPMAGIPAVEYSSVVVLSDAAGNSVELAPLNVTPNSIKVAVPANLPVGNYTVVAKKLDKLSNPESLVVKPAVAIASADLKADGSIVIQGKGFGMQPPQAQGLGVNVGNAPADVITWNDGQIVVKAAGAKAGQTVEVLSTYVVSAQLTGAVAPPVVEEPVKGGKGGKDKTPPAPAPPKKNEVKKGR